MKMKSGQRLLIKSMGKSIRVTAIFHSDEMANNYLKNHPDEGVIALFEPYVFIANLYDFGESNSREARGR